MFTRRSIVIGVVLLGLSVTTNSWAQTKPLTVGFDGARLEQALGTPVRMEFTEMPLNDAIEQLSQSLAIDVRLDARALEDSAIPTDSIVNLSKSGLAFQDALEIMLDPLELTWMPRFRAIYVTTPEVAEQHMVTRVYPVMDLVATQRETRLEFDAEQSTKYGLIYVVQSTISPDSWEINGGNGSLEWHERTGALVCTQTWQVHQQVESLLESLRQSRDLQKIDWSRVRSVGLRAQPTTSGGLENVFGKGNGGGFFHVDDATWRKPRVHE